MLYASPVPFDGGRFVRLIAHHVGAEVHASSRRASADLPVTGERFEGHLLPPRNALRSANNISIFLQSSREVRASHDLDRIRAIRLGECILDNP